MGKGLCFFPHFFTYYKGGDIMSMCEYCEIGSYFGFCTCIKSHETCPFMRRCNVEHKWLPIDSMDVCRLRQPERSMVLKNNEYKVRFEKEGDLYIEMGDYVIQKKNPYDYIPEKVTLIEVDGELYFEGFVPRVQEDKQEEAVVKKTIKKKNKK